MVQQKVLVASVRAWFHNLVVVPVCFSYGHQCSAWSGHDLPSSPHYYAEFLSECDFIALKLCFHGFVPILVIVKKLMHVDFELEQ